MIIPIFLSASIRVLAFLSLILLPERLTIRSGDSLSRYLMIIARTSSVNELFDRLRLETLPRKSIIF